MIPKQLRSALKAIPNLTLYTDPADCWAYGTDNSRRHACPDMVAIPSELAQVATIVKHCYDARYPVISRGRASGTTGGCVPITGGLVLSLERLNKIIDFDPDNRTMIVEAGVLNRDVQTLAATEGLFWPPDPSSRDYCTVGGNLACCAAGPRAVKYGTCRENTLGLTTVIGTGETLKTGTLTTKGVVGYDLTRLLVGSEGTLGVITTATLKLLPSPTASQVFSAFYSDIAGATAAITAMMRRPIAPSTLEFMDANCLDLIRDHHDTVLPANAKAMLLFSADGSPEDIPNQAAALATVCQNAHCIAFSAAKNAEEAQQLWQTRKALSPTLRKLSPHKINEDVVVPVPHIPTLLAFIDEQASKHDLLIVNFGHAGNGNIHVNILADQNDPVVGPRAEACLDAIFDKVLSLNGTLSGEHGVGVEKRDFINRELDPIAFSLMRGIKQQFDPHQIMNPDKLFKS